MKFPASILILIFIVNSIFLSAHASSTWNAEEKELMGKCENALAYRRFRTLAETADKLEKSARRSNNRETADIGLALSLYASILTEDSSTTERKADEAADRLSETGEVSGRAASWLNMALSEYNISRLDYPKAASHALEALKGAKSLHLYDLAVTASGQLARIYSNKEDMSGIRWARECQRLSEKTQSPASRYISAVNLGSYLLKEGNYGQAEDC